MPKEDPCRPYFDSILLFCLLKELGELEGKKVKAVKREDEQTFVLCFADQMLLVSTNPVLYRAHLTPGKPLKHMGKHSFEEHLKFRKVTQVRQLGLDRIFALGFSKSGIHPSHHLICELIGPSSNVFLIDERSTIIASHRKSRKNKKGETYQLGGKSFDELARLSAEGILIDLVTEERGTGKLQQQLKKSPAWLSRIMNTMDKRKLRKKLKTFLEQPQPYIHYEASKPCFITPVKLSSQSKPYDSFSSAIAALYHHFLDERVRDQAKRELAKKLKNCRKIQKKLARDQEKADLSGEFRQKGELILLHIRDIERGAKTLTVPDPYDEEHRIVIELDPAKTASRNAAAYFKKARKADKRKKSIKRRTAEIAAEITRLIELMESVNELPEQALEKILKSSQPATRAKEKETPRPFREFKTTTGRTLLVGRSNKENEHLTFHVAKPKDIFFHVREAPGSHTILVNDGNVTKADIQEAAGIAAHFSKAKHSTIVPVSYTERRYVRKSKRLGTGKVIISHEKTIFVEPTPPPRKKEI